MKLSEEEKISIIDACIESCSKGQDSICVFLARELSLCDLNHIYRTNVYREMRLYAMRNNLNISDGISWFSSQEDRISFISNFGRYLKSKQLYKPYTADDAASFLGKLITHVKSGSIYGLQGVVTSCTPSGYIMAGGIYMTLDRAFTEIEHIDGRVFGRVR